MELNRNRWYVQWFFLSLRIVDRFTKRNNEFTYKMRGTNLCHFMRVTLIWSPLIVLLHLALYGLALSALVIVPLHFFGLVGSAKFVGIILSTFVALTALFFLIWAAVKLTSVFLRGSSSFALVLRERKERAEAERAIKGPSFGSMVWQYAVATKRRICPVITFNET